MRFFEGGYGDWGANVNAADGGESGRARKDDGTSLRINRREPVRTLMKTGQPMRRSSFAAGNGRSPAHAGICAVVTGTRSP